ncbi:uncharacterized protein LOC144434333 [Glandiceps talaboti]
MATHQRGHQAGGDTESTAFSIFTLGEDMSMGSLSDLSETSESVQNLFGWSKKGGGRWGCDPKKRSGKRWQLIKMMAITMIPITTLIGVATNNLLLTMRANTASFKVREAIRFGKDLGNFLHHLQNERDMTTLYLSSISPLSRKFLTDTYPETDNALQQLQSWPINSDNLLSEIDSNAAFQRFLDTHRRDLYISNADLFKEIEFYSTAVKFFIDWLYEAVGQFQGSNQGWTILVGYQLLIVSKEDVGIERTLGSVYYSQGRFNEYDHFIDFLEKSFRAQGNFEASWQYAPEIKTMHDELMDDLPGDVVNAMAGMRNIIRQNVEVEPSWLGANYWFSNMTNYMEILLQIQNKLTDLILITLEDEVRKDRQSLVVVAFILVLASAICPLVLFLVTRLTSNMQVFASTLVGQNKELKKERKRALSLLYRMLPKVVAEQLKKNEQVTAESYRSSTIFFSDIVGFTSICSQSSPLQVVRMLNMLYTCFDGRIDKYDVYKVETIGDAYMVVSGIPKKNDNKHAGEIATLSLDLKYHVSCLTIDHLPGVQMKLRIGIHSGPVVAGVVGTKMPRYCLFGDTVNIAERMETVSEADRIHVSVATYEILMDLGSYYLSERGITELEGKGSFLTYWLNGKDGFDPEAMSTTTPSCFTPLNAPSTSSK